MQIDLSQLITAEARAATLLAERRAAMRCSRLQGRLTLGPEVCAALDAIAADPETPWAMRETIAHAVEWQRMSQTMDELAWVLGFTGDQMDVLFDQAQVLRV